MSIVFKTIAAFYEAVKTGIVDESKLDIILDNDHTDFYVEKGPRGMYVKINVQGTDGYNDIDKLYSLLFPKARVDWY
jgi:hypothetical protein